MSLKLRYQMQNDNALYSPINYPEMTIGDVKRIDRLNKKYGYGITKNALLQCVYRYRKAKERNDIRTMSMVEYRLTDINFHYEYGLIANGKFEECIKSIKEHW